ncbi:MAG TPA: caspase family protein [Blastocatellia bacterium]|nr:caspase family protein [Blastocatellia bacterium]
MKMLKRALLVGIDRYDNMSPLQGCVNDVDALHPLLAKNENRSPNFDCQVRKAPKDRVDRRSLLSDLKALFAPGADVALFYFAGHGEQKQSDVVIATQDGAYPELGMALSTILGLVQDSKVQEVLIILDCCYAGGAGGVPQLGSNVAALRSGVSILSASRGDQTAAETEKGRGLFSSYLCEALKSGAADVLGKVTVASVFTYVSESFGPWRQRPMFKSNVDRLHELRLCSPWVPIAEVRLLPKIFQRQDSSLPLDRSYEPSVRPRNKEHEAIFAILQKCRAAKLVEPVGTEHMYYAAMLKKKCRLTPLGRHYWRMAKEGRL